MSNVRNRKNFVAITRSRDSVALCRHHSTAPRASPSSEARTSAGVPGQVWVRAAGGNHFDGPKDIVYPTKLAPQDTRLNMYFGDWHDSMPRAMFGSLVVRDILTPGDNLSPPFPGAVLEQAKFLSYGTLAAGERTVPSTLKGRADFFLRK